MDTSTSNATAAVNVDPVIDDAEATADTPFDWRNCWYPVTFLQDLPKDRPTGFAIYDEPMVLFVDGRGQVGCLPDRCPHRAARLSDGQIMDGRLECRYHGWQFGADGQCLRVPQLWPEKDIPDRACLPSHPVQIARGIVWVWTGEAGRADPALIPGGAEGEGLFEVTFQMDLPYDQSYLIENVIDVAHIHIAHDGVRGGGRREAALPLEFDIQESSRTAIRSRYRSVGLKRQSQSPSMKGALVEFIAPNLIRYGSDYANPKLVAGLELYSLPIGKGRCRLLYRKYSNFTSWRERIKPRWREHQIQCTILEQDMAVVIGQHAEIETAGRPLRELWLPLRSSDRLVVEYRKWLDRFGGDLPFYRGFATAKNSGLAPDLSHAPKDRHHLHTQVCATCTKLNARLQMAIRGLWVVAAGCAALAPVTLPAVFAVAALLALAAVAGLGRLQATL